MKYVLFHDGGPKKWLSLAGASLEGEPRNLGVSKIPNNPPTLGPQRLEKMKVLSPKNYGL